MREKKTRRRFPFFLSAANNALTNTDLPFLPSSRLAVKALLLRSDRARMGESLLKTSEFERATGNAFLSLLLYFLTLTTQICVHCRFSYSGQYPPPRRRSNNKKHSPHPKKKGAPSPKRGSGREALLFLTTHSSSSPSKPLSRPFL